MCHQSKKGINFETEDNLRQPNDDERARTDNTQHAIRGTEANGSDSVPSTRSGEAPNQGLEDSWEQCQYAMIEKLLHCFREFWDDFWDLHLQQIYRDIDPVYDFRIMYKYLFGIRREIMREEYETFKKKLDMEQGTEEERGHICNTQLVMETNEAFDSDFTRSSKKLIDIKNKYEEKYRKCWDDYWKNILQLIQKGASLFSTFNSAFKFTERHYQSIGPPEAPTYIYKGLAQGISVRSLFLLNPTQTEHEGEEVIICRFQLETRTAPYTIEQPNDPGVMPEDILFERLRMLREKNSDTLSGLELVCSWSSRERCIKLATDIKKVIKEIVTVIVRTKSKPTTLTSSLPDLEVQHLNIDWEELYKYLRFEGRMYFGYRIPPMSEAFNGSWGSVEHRRVLPLDMWNVFNSQLRTRSIEHVAFILCCVTFENGNIYCLVQGNKVKNLHAERIMIMRLKAMQAKAREDNPIRRIRIYSTYTPCIGCSQRYSEFIEGMHQLEELHLIVSSVHMSYDSKTNSALKNFWMKSGVKVESFNDEHWKDLIKHLTEEAKKYLDDQAKSFESYYTHYRPWM